MAKLQPPKSTTSKLARVVVKNSATGAFLTGLVYNTSGLTAYYIREGDSTTTAISLVSATLGTWTSGGFVVVDATNMPGVYELGIPNACFASGNSFVIYLQGAANMICNPIEFESTSVSNQDGVRGGMTALPNAAASASGGLPTFGTGSGQINPNGSGAVPASTLNGVVPPTNWASESIDSSGRVLLQPTQTGVTIPTVTTVGSVTGSVGSISGITFPSNFGTFSIDSSGRVTLIPGDVPPSTSAIAAAILATPAHLLATDASGDVTFNNTSIGAVTGAVGSISGITFPSNFGTFSIDSSGRVTLTPTNNALIATDVAAVVPTDASITTDVETALTAQGYTSVRAGYLDTLNGIVANIWAYATRTLSAFAFGVTVTTNNDKTGYSLSTSDRTSATVANLTQGSAGTQQFTAEALELAPSGGGGLTGPETVTLSFVDSLGNPVPYVTFYVYEQGSATTNVDGVYAFGLANGNYTVTAYPVPGMLWPSTPLTVDGTTAHTIQSSAETPPAPPDPTSAPDTYGQITAKAISFPQAPINTDMLWVVGDTQPLVTIMLFDGNGVPINLSGASSVVVEYVSSTNTAEVVQTSTAYVSVNGTMAYYERSASDYTTLNPGWYYARVIASYLNSTSLSGPSTGQLNVLVKSAFS